MNRWWKRLAWGLVLVVFVTCGGLRAGLTAEQWAAWVQAVGSIAAILVAIAVSRDQSVDQRNSAETLRLESEIQTVVAIKELVDQVAAYSEFIHAGAKDDLWASEWKSISVHCEDLLAICRSIPIMKAPDEKLLQHLMLIRQLLVSYVGSTNELGAQAERSKLNSSLLGLATDAQTTNNEARTHCEALLIEKRKALATLASRA